MINTQNMVFQNMNDNNYVIEYQFKPVRDSLAEPRFRENDDENKEITTTARLIIH